MKDWKIEWDTTYAPYDTYEEYLAAITPTEEEFEQSVAAMKSGGLEDDFPF
jgi:hypothetical protein